MARLPRLASGGGRGGGVSFPSRRQHVATSQRRFKDEKNPVGAIFPAIRHNSCGMRSLHPFSDATAAADVATSRKENIGFGMVKHENFVCFCRLIPIIEHISFM
ncbi:hypothetical protein AVEN_102988-1 [Araneus ventricosus]|uniref:Uncharacterized protein n=1 Tax=Araneus ventricosus TaxID=182803 RepID=A0A4Y2BB25_ARAVE|nr:hypothetical protein AVEN_102988-1 [Araneus ventricosus]